MGRGGFPRGFRYHVRLHVRYSQKRLRLQSSWVAPLVVVWAPLVVWASLLVGMPAEVAEEGLPAEEGRRPLGLLLVRLPPWLSPNSPSTSPPRRGSS